MFSPVRRKTCCGRCDTGKKTGLLSLTFDGKVLCGISLRPLPETVYSENTAASEDTAAQKDADTGRASLREAGSEPVSAGSSKAAVPDRPARLSDSRVRQLRKDNSEVQQLLFLAEQYLGRTLSPTDISRILYFYDELRFPMDLLEYLIEYCVSRGNTSLHYIEKVGLEWHRDGIQTVKMAKTRTSTWNKSYFSILKAFGIRNRNPIPSETEFMDRWLKEYGFSQDIIAEACARTITQTGQPSFQYAEGILSNWKQEGVRTAADITSLDTKHRELRQQKPSPAKSGRTQSANRFNNFHQREYDYSQLEKQLLEKQLMDH